MKESDLQQMINDYLSKSGVLYFAPLTETAMQIMIAFKVPKKICHCIINHLKKMGMLPGIPDLVILKKGVAYFLELKVDKGKLSERQTIIHKVLRANRFNVETAWTFDEAVAIFKKWGVTK